MKNYIIYNGTHYLDNKGQSKEFTLNNVYIFKDLKLAHNMLPTASGYKICELIFTTDNLGAKFTGTYVIKISTAYLKIHKIYTKEAVITTIDNATRFKDIKYAKTYVANLDPLLDFSIEPLYYKIVFTKEKFNEIERANSILKHIRCKCLDTNIFVFVKQDALHKPGRLYLQATYRSKCIHTDKMTTWSGRKNFLSEFMTDDEIVKTAYLTFKQAVEHEIMEGFTYDNKVVFNPHVNFKELLNLKEISRDETYND